MQTITKGSAEWRQLFQGADTDAFWGNTYRTDKIFAKGDLSALLDPSRPKVLVTGTRDITGNEKDIIYLILEALAQNPSRPVIVSGLSVGTDTAVHECALKLGLATVAVLPCWIGDIYPSYNKGLARRISETPGCALLSQYPEGTLPEPLTMLVRNRTMAMASDIAVIPFCRHSGGAKTVALLMYDLGKRVLAVPGRITDTRSEGCNELIHHGQAELLEFRYGFPLLRELPGGKNEQPTNTQER